MNLADIGNLKPAQLKRMLDAVLLEQERRSYSRLVDFVQGAWHIIEPSEEYKHNWHIDVICEHLEAVTRGEIKNLLINVPPGTMKSILVSVMWPAWEWTQNPALRYFGASYDESLSIRDAMKCRDIITSDWYQRLWPDVQIRKDTNQKLHYALTGGGFRMSSSVGGRGTGHHPDRKIVDDPHNVKKAESDAERKQALDWFDRTLTTRGASRNAATVVVMQRLHEKDLTGHIMQLGDYRKDWVHLCIPMEYEGPIERAPFKDPRSEHGELLWPSLHTRKIVDTLKIRLGEYGSAGQLQQRPSPAGGGILKTKHFQLWPANMPLPDLEFIVQSYDTAFTDDESNDPTACTVWGLFTYKRRKCALLLDAWDEHLSYPDLREKLISDWSAKYGGVNGDPLHPSRRADVLLIEEKASGIALVRDLRAAGVPVQTYNPGKASKELRAHLSAPVLEMNVLYVLESKKEPGKPITWARPFLRQAEQFPNSEHKDLVDSFTQCAIYFKDTNMLVLPEFIDDEPEVIDYHAQRKRGRNPYAS
jgi:predicted phage terminase large subunit-like protein